jgi:hypothetical protein
MRKETIEAIIKTIRTPPGKCVSVTVRGRDQFGNEILEQVFIPKKEPNKDEGVVDFYDDEAISRCYAKAIIQGVTDSRTD